VGVRVIVNKKYISSLNGLNRWVKNLKEELDINKNEEYCMFVFRGHSNEKYLLIPEIIRKKKIKKVKLNIKLLTLKW
jgi:hypothetical protein